MDKKQVIETTNNPVNLNYHPVAINNKIAFKGTAASIKNMPGVNALYDFITNPKLKNFFIFPHIKPDVDAGASALQISDLCKIKGKNAKIFTSNSIDNIKFLDSNNEIINIKKLERLRDSKGSITIEKLREEFGVPDGIIITDASDIHRIDEKIRKAFIDPLVKIIKEDPSNNNKKIAIVDHHIDKNDSYFDGINVIKLIDPESESASQVALQCFDKFGINLDQQNSNRLLAGFYGDTQTGKYLKNPKTAEEDVKILSQKADINYIKGQVNKITPEEAKAALTFQKNTKVVDDIAYFVVDGDSKKLPETVNGINLALEEISKRPDIKYYFCISEIKDPQTGKIIEHTASLISKDQPITEISDKFSVAGHEYVTGFKVNGETTDSLTAKLINEIKLLEQSHAHAA